MTDVDVESDADGPVGAPQPPVELAIPADTRAVRLARLVTSGVASAAGFDVEEVEDLRIAVDELCALLLACDARDVLRLSWRSSPGTIEIVAAADVSGTAGAGDELALQVLGVVVDQVERHDAPGTVSYRVVRRREAAGGG